MGSSSCDDVPGPCSLHVQIYAFAAGGDHTSAAAGMYVYMLFNPSWATYRFTRQVSHADAAQQRTNYLTPTKQYEKSKPKSAPMNQLSKENINLVRLINRLDKNTYLHVKRKRMPDCIHHHPPETPDADHQLDHEHFDHQRYWELKGLETVSRSLFLSRTHS